MSDQSTLRLGLCHLEVARGRVEWNLAEVVQLSRRAAESGANIIVHTEMALSGYGFDSRAELLPLALEADSDRLEPLARLCREQGCYLVLGLAELEPGTGLIYNCALMWGPDGRINARRRKVTAEAKWAAAGRARQPECLCDTPWGRVGLAICSETYFGLVPRSLALAGADLILVPANWPPSGLDPAALWRLRALENGLHVAACNRTGRDKLLDCTATSSVVFGPAGNCLARHSGPTSQLMMVDLPLINGRLDPSARSARLESRKPADYAYLAHDLRAISDLTVFLELPRPGLLALWTACPPPPVLNGRADQLAAWLAGEAIPAGAVTLLPGMDGRRIGVDDLTRLAQRLNLTLAARLADRYLVLATAQGSPSVFDLRDDLAGEPRLVDWGGARLALVTAGELMHPETAVVLGKRGCDVALVSTGELEPDRLDCLAGRSLDKVVICEAGAGGGLAALPPEGHQAWQEWRTDSGSSRGRIIKLEPLRRKKYLERLDLELLLAPLTGTALGGGKRCRQPMTTPAPNRGPWPADTVL